MANWYEIFSIHRPIDRVRGFTRETLIGLVADIETRLWRHSFNEANAIPAEHPRASTTDDVECFFSVLRDCVGKDFTLKQVNRYTGIIITWSMLLVSSSIICLKKLLQ